MASYKIGDLYFVFQFLRRLTQPYRKWGAYLSGVIDKDGNVVVPPKERTKEQKDSFTATDLMILKLKRIMAKVPGGKSNFATYGAALLLLKENIEERQMDNKEFNDSLLEFLRETSTDLKEEGPTNSVGGGAISGLGYKGTHDIKTAAKRKVASMFHKKLMDRLKDINKCVMLDEGRRDFIRAYVHLRGGLKNLSEEEKLALVESPLGTTTPNIGDRVIFGKGKKKHHGRIVSVGIKKGRNVWAVVKDNETGERFRHAPKYDRDFRKLPRKWNVMGEDYIDEAGKHTFDAKIFDMKTSKWKTIATNLDTLEQAEAEVRKAKPGKGRGQVTRSDGFSKVTKGL